MNGCSLDFILSVVMNNNKHNLNSLTVKHVERHNIAYLRSVGRCPLSSSFHAVQFPCQEQVRRYPDLRKQQKHGRSESQNSHSRYDSSLSLSRRQTDRLTSKFNAILLFIIINVYSNRKIRVRTNLLDKNIEAGRFLEKYDMIKNQRII